MVCSNVQTTYHSVWKESICKIIKLNSSLWHQNPMRPKNMVDIIPITLDYIHISFEDIWLTCAYKYVDLPWKQSVSGSWVVHISTEQTAVTHSQTVDLSSPQKGPKHIFVLIIIIYLTCIIRTCKHDMLSYARLLYVITVHSKHMKHLREE